MANGLPAGGAEAQARHPELGRHRQDLLVLAGLAIAIDFPSRPNPQPEMATAQLGVELLGDSMLVFQSAGVALLSAMIGAVAIASRRGRYGSAEDESDEPTLDVPEQGAS